MSEGVKRRDRREVELDDEGGSEEVMCLRNVDSDCGPC